jgi:serine/threonine protein kinase
VIGKGSYGKVLLVRKKDTGKNYALKILKKDEIMKRNQFEHTMAERRILVRVVINKIAISKPSIYCENGLCFLVGKEIVFLP